MAIDFFADRDLTELVDFVELSEGATKLKESIWVVLVHTWCCKVKDGSVTDVGGATKVTERDGGYNLSQGAISKSSSIEEEKHGGDTEHTHHEEQAAHVLEELEIEDGSDTVLGKVTMSALATAAVVAPGTGLANRVLLVSDFFGHGIFNLLAWMNLVHHGHHFDGTQAASSVVGIRSIHLDAF